eukprot:TRINITY_DN6030_c0_g1_i7.p1 TRINITY_DN6030_c0_g1~~TRINITY_DN6030_c0_g1_i7.p1  ORF type:complete len:192 (+),score=32.86 TRINITY_DN6030_c0_g1_i7:102-677(+)
MTLPTLAWACFHWEACSMSWFLSGVVYLGMALSVAMIAGLSISPVLALLWFLYLSIAKIGQGFMSFQWDTLLLEVGFMAILVAPMMDFRMFSVKSKPSNFVVFMFRWLMFRVMFTSGIGKLNPSWTSFRAFTHLFETQYLPSPLSWHFHQMPLLLHQMGTLFTYAIEILGPFLIFSPNRTGRVVGGIMMSL